MTLRLSICLLASSVALAACHGPSDVGKVQQPAPVAVAATVGQPYTTDSAGVLHTSVRAGADVVLTGVNSYSGNDSNGAPIITFGWQQQSAAGSPTVDLIKRTANTVSFRAPDVTSPTTLTFQLSVADASGQSATTRAQVAVEPVRDPDHFLDFLSVPDHVLVTAATDKAVTADAAAAYNVPVPYVITVTKLVTYTDMSHTQHPKVPVGQPVTYHGSWAAALGTGTGCGDVRNPQILVPIPRLNLDDPLGDGSGQRLSDVMQSSDVDLDPANSQIPPATVYAQITIAPDPSAQSPAGVTPEPLPAGVTPLVCVGGASAPDAISGAAASATFSSQYALAKVSPSGLYDSSASAHAYYQTIDPTNSKTTLADWLKANGMDQTAKDWGADTHAVYTNNFDLGFGRDMYVKVGGCDSGYSAAPLSQFAAQTPLGAAAVQQLQQLMGHCDVAAVVVNYVGLQAAAEHLNAINAVAMEYSASQGSGSRFVKFYVFAPDTGTGAMERVTSADLDHRGQKYVPQACVVCHGGTPGTVSTDSGGHTTYSSGGDVNAGFLPWDLDSLLYSDTDPGFSQKPQDAALKAAYTRTTQEPSLKLLNVGTYLTLADPSRFGLERELLEGWYGGPGLPGAYSGSFVPPGWQPGGTDGNPADSASVYTHVFARYCRMCHIEQAPAAGISLIPAASGGTNGSGTSSCASTTTDSGVGATDQFPMGCYWQFANAPQLAAVVGGGEMPFARRTTDRMWVQPDGSASDGATLQSHFAGQTPSVAIVTPGTDVANIAPPPAVANPCGATSSNGVPSVDVGDPIRLDATGSLFADSPTWSVAACTGTPSSPGQCGTPVTVSGPNSVVGGFIPSSAVTYQIMLALGGGQGAAAASYYLPVPVCQPQLAAPPLQVNMTADITANVPLTGSGGLIEHYGNGAAGGTYILLQSTDSDLQVTPQACTVEPGCRADTLGNTFNLLWTGASPTTCSACLTLTVTSSGSPPSAGSVSVTVASAAQAPAEFTLSPSVTANATTPQSFNVLTGVENQANSQFPLCSTVQVENVQYLGGRAESPTFDQPSQTLSYLPEQGFATYDKTGTVAEAQCGVNDSTCTPERFSYDLVCTVGGHSQTSSGYFDVAVKAEVSISDAESVWLNNGCTLCHDGSTAPDFGHNLNSLKTGHLSKNSAIAYVNVGSVSLSGLLCWPEEDGLCTSVPPGQNHTGGPISPGVLQDVQKWIADGANPF